MKKIVKRILMVFGIVVLIIVLFTGGFFLKMKSEMKEMTPTRTKEVITNIFSIKDSFVNLFLIKDSDEYVAIDAGNDLDVVSGELQKLNINPEKVVAVMLTHTDRDHVGALKLFKNAKIYLSRQEEQMINGEKSKFFFISNKIGTKEYKLIEDQQIINIKNIKIKGILTPGHTSGSMCYLINDKYLFTGDVLSLKAGKIDKPIDFFNMDSKTAVKSIGIVTKIPEAEYIFTAHYGFSNDYKNAVKDWKN